MRRPAPLPSPPDARERPVSDASRARRGRRRGVDDVDTAAGVAGGPAAAGRPDPSAVDDSGPQPTSTRDVWRAARARRRALRSEIRRFTQRSRRRRIAWTVGIGAIVLLIGGSVAAAYSPLFAVEHITVAGAT